MTKSLQPAGAGGRQAPKPITLSIPLLFERPLTPAQCLSVERVAMMLMEHRFELHDIRPEGEQVSTVVVRDHIRSIDTYLDEDNPMEWQIQFVVGSKKDKEALVWTSSLMFQYLHYHLARLALINNASHTLDWDAKQDPDLPNRVREWVESGESRIERLKRVKPS